MFAKFKLTPTDKDIINNFGDWRGGINLGIKESEYEEYLENLLALVNDRLPNVELYEGARTAVSRLKSGGKRLALLTSSSNDNLNGALDNTGLRKYFEFVITAEGIKHHKPHPEITNRALQMMGAVAKETVMVGDSPKDIGAAKNAGVDSVLFHSSAHDKFYDIEKLMSLHPTYTIDHLAELSL